MKVLQVHNWYRFGGGENVMFESITRMLKYKGHKVLILERFSHDVRSMLQKISAFTEGIYSSAVKREISSIIASERPEVVHIHNLYPLISPSVLASCRHYNVPVVLRCPTYRLTCPAASQAFSARY